MTARLGARVIDILEQAGERYLKKAAPDAYAALLLQVGGADTFRQYDASATYWERGRYLPDSLREIDFILRDFRTGDVRTIDPALLDLLHRLCATMEYEASISVISGYRCPATNAMLAARSNRVAKNSFHVRGMAIDFRLPGRQLATVRASAMALASGGVGYYPQSDFVHVDTGPVRAW